MQGNTASNWPHQLEGLCRTRIVDSLEWRGGNAGSELHVKDESALKLIKNYRLEKIIRNYMDFKNFKSHSHWHNLDEYANFKNWLHRVSNFSDVS